MVEYINPTSKMLILNNSVDPNMNNSTKQLSTSTKLSISQKKGTHSSADVNQLAVSGNIVTRSSSVRELVSGKERRKTQLTKPTIDILHQERSRVIHHCRQPAHVHLPADDVIMRNAGCRQKQLL
jgi:hypothetical protein